jgi:hypothetical protein
MKPRKRNTKQGNIFMGSKMVLIIITSTMNFLYSQETAKGLDNYSKFSLSCYLAYTIGGPSTNIEAAMKNSGFDDRSSDWIWEGKEHPETRLQGLPWMIELQYRMNKLVAIGFQISNSVPEETVGYACPQGGFGEYLFLNYSAKTIAPIVSYYLNENFILGIGPSLNTVICYEDEVGKKRNYVEKSNIGLVTQINYRFNIGSIFFGKVIFQYRFIGSNEIGPIIKEDKIGIASPTPSVKYITFPKTEINYNHLFLGFGIGISL